MSAAVEPNLSAAFLAQASVSQKKVVEYLLNLMHADGGPKAKFFLRFGFSIESWHLLADALQLHPADNGVDSAIPTEFGLKFTVKCNLRTPDGRQPCIRTVWMVQPGAVPSLVTAYPE